MHINRTKRLKVQLLASTVVAFAVAALVPQAYAGFKLPKVSPPKIRVPNVGRPGLPKPFFRPLKQPKIRVPLVSRPVLPTKPGPWQKKLGTEMAAGAAGGAAGGAAFGSGAGPAGTVAGAAGGAAAGAVGGGVGYTFKNHAKKKWGWK